jgi:hypothetical protein
MWASRRDASRTRTLETIYQLRADITSVNTPALTRLGRAGVLLGNDTRAPGRLGWGPAIRDEDRFHAQHAYALMMKALTRFEFAPAPAAWYRMRRLFGIAPARVLRVMPRKVAIVGELFPSRCV